MSPSGLVSKRSPRTVTSFPPPLKSNVPLVHAPEDHGAVVRDEVGEATPIMVAVIRNVAMGNTTCNRSPMSVSTLEALVRCGHGAIPGCVGFSWVSVLPSLLLLPGTQPSANQNVWDQAYSPSSSIGLGATSGCSQGSFSCSGVRNCYDTCPARASAPSE